MALFNGGRGLLAGIGIGVLAAAVGRRIAPAFAGLGRPVAKAAIKSGLILYDRGRVQFAVMRETFDDLAAEARVEIERESREEAAGAAAAPAPKESAAYASESLYRA
jgi:hypothetical protein